MRIPRILEQRETVMRPDTSERPAMKRPTATKRMLLKHRKKPWWAGLVLTVGGLAAAMLGAIVYWIASTYFPIV